MKIGKLISQLKSIRKEQGDIDVYIWDTYIGTRKEIEMIRHEKEINIVDLVEED